MEPVVSVRKCDNYDKALVKAAVQKTISDIGGISNFVKTGDKALLKPNLLLSAKPEKAIVTHPAVVEAVAELVIDAGAKPAIGDSPPVGKLNRVLAKSGYSEFMGRLGIPAAPFLEKRAVDYGEDHLFRRIEIADTIGQFDKVINIAKLKTHCQMLLTLSVKNLFGAIIGTDKMTWHLKAGKDYETFATVLVQIYHKIGPCLSLVDGILAMEGKGPNNGSPRSLGLISGSSDGVALDAVIRRLVGFSHEEFLTCRVAQRMGAGVADTDRIKVVGDELKGFPLKDFERPPAMSIKWNLSERNPLRRLLESQAVARPDIEASKCAGCGICRDHCPPEAIFEKDGVMVIDKGKCISCFCCHELCERDAINIRTPALGRILSRISR